MKEKNSEENVWKEMFQEKRDSKECGRQQVCSGSNPKEHDRSSMTPNRWKPYTPAVSQILEKAYRSRLTQVLLGDADPALSKFR